MYIFKNAFISITRNKGRNVLMGIILIVIATSCAITLAIKNTASTLITSYKEKQEVTASISMDRKNMMLQMKPDNENREEMLEQFQNIPSLTIEEIEKYGDSSYLKSYYYTASFGLNSDTLKKAESSIGGMGGNRPGFGKDFQGNSTDFTITGYSSIEAMIDFIEGGYTITEGEVSSDFTKNNCVINEELATLNGISVGDTITFQDENNEKTFSFTVTGIYSDNKESDNPMSLFSNSANTIITNATAVANIQNELDTNLTVNPTFILNSEDVLEQFTKELKDKGLNEYFTLQTNLDESENSLSTISNVSSFATTFLIITLIIGIIVLFVINMINVRERKYEIGVLRTIGMKKSTLTLQFVFELLMITVVSLVIGASLGAMMSVPVSNKLLQNEINSSQNEQNRIDKNFGGIWDEGGRGGRPTMIPPTISAFDSIDAVVDAEVLFQLFFIGIFLTIVSSSAAMIHIQKFSPLTILKERS